ncbi:zinc finger, CCHC-type containing protein [Tanacetum coccineum]
MVEVDDVSLVDGVFDSAFGGDGEEDFVMGKRVVVSSSSLERSTKCCLGGIVVSLIFLEGLEEEACVDAIVVYVLTTPIPEDGGDDPTVEQVRKRNKKELWNSLDSKYMAKFTQHKINMDEAIQVSCIIDKLPPSWKDFKDKKKELTLVELGSHLRIEESLRTQDSDKPKGNNVVGPQLNIVNNIGKSAFMSTFKLNDSITWYVRLGNVHFNNNMQDMSKDGLILVLTWTLKNVKLKTKVLELIHSNLCDLHATPSMRNKKYFMTFIDDASRFCYVYLLHSKDEALDKFKVFKTEV